MSDGAIQCYRLSDGANIIDEESMAKLLQAMNEDSLDAGDIDDFARFQRGEDPRG